MPRTMNDPHVVALTFRIEHDSSVAYRADAPPIQHQEEAFRVTLEDGTVRFELEEHHATEEGALESVLPYVRSWGLDACLRERPGDFRLQFQQAEIIDPEPTATRARVRRHLRFRNRCSRNPRQRESLCYEALISLTAVGPDAQSGRPRRCDDVRPAVRLLRRPRVAAEHGLLLLNGGPVAVSGQSQPSASCGQRALPNR